MPTRRLSLVLALAGTLVACDDDSTDPIVEPPPVITLTLVAGDGQDVLADDTTDALVVRVEVDGEPLAGAEVSWQAAASLALLPDLQTVTAADGTTSVRAVAIGAPGAFTVSASVDTVGVTFDVTVLPEPGGPVSRFTQVSAGAFHTCALGDNSLAYCWGWNESGQLGVGDNANRDRPTVVSDSIAFESVHAGAYHTCGLTRDGAVWCWGMAIGGRLGVAEAAASAICVGALGSVPCEKTPRRVQTALAFRSLSVLQNTCGVTASGEAWCWGFNDWSQLGAGSGETCTSTFGTLACSSTPVRVSGGITWRSVSAGWATACGIATDGAGYCWGYGGDGRLGVGSAASVTQPTRIARVASFDRVAVGAFLTCGVAANDAAFCWGVGYLGQLGTSESVATCLLFDREVPCALQPAAVAGSRAWSDIASSSSSDVMSVHACALDADGAAFCWGGNTEGQLGTSTLEVCVEPGHGTEVSCARAPVPVGGGHRFEAIALGDIHSCALKPEGEVWCWGMNAHGQLGDGTHSGGQFAVRALLPEA